ncbi:hypothetical protein K503DRAFT_797882 [Rhizopogon vinicolor AM-OR11-026]|uniref:Heterokaryon incompatibility domain-containing protein n=1 Tax=Rhizopogon vinicolor AM-OR11-026 TaxID=1314800 RepID=A0A1B7N9L2_9AGAM|nr:hypothetical protein K503DRAFT_797882 [Rhizopogon vinicolor AM-OR11-026]
MAEDTEQSVIPRSTPVRVFEDGDHSVLAVVVFPDRQRMVTSGRSLRLWDLNRGVLLKKTEGRHDTAWALAVSQDGTLIASGHFNGDLIIWRGDTCESLTHPIPCHSECIMSLNFSPDGRVLATGSSDNIMKLWNTGLWHLQGNPIDCGARVHCVRYSPSGRLLAVATSENIQIWNPSTRDRVADFKAHASFLAANLSLAWSPDSTSLLSTGDQMHPTILQWDTSTWQQVEATGHPIYHGHDINAIAINSTGTLVASSSDGSVLLWRFLDRQIISVFCRSAFSVTFSTDSKHIFSGGNGGKISQFAVPEHALPDDPPEQLALRDVTRHSNTEIFTMNMTTRNACITGDLQEAEELLTQYIDADANNDYNSYANRSFVMARKLDWDRALHDALKSVSVQPSLAGYVSKGIALCGKKQLRDAMNAFDIAFMFANEHSNTILLLLLIKAIALFNANQHEEAMMRVRELSTACPSADALTCCIVQAYLRVQMGITALDGTRHDEAAEHFTAVVKATAFIFPLTIHSMYEDFVVLFGWDLKSLWPTANQKRCHALLRADRLGEAVESYRQVFSNVIPDHDAHLHSTQLSNKNAAHSVLATGMLPWLQATIKGLLTYTQQRSTWIAKAKSEKMLWEEALLDAQKVIELNPVSYLGYELKYAALHGAQRYDEAIEAVQSMLSKFDSNPEAQIRSRPLQQYLSLSEAEVAVQKVVLTQTENVPLRLLDTTTGRLCDREAQIRAFKASTECKELLSLTMKHADRRMERNTEVVAKYFHYVMLSHRWEAQEPLLHEIQDKVVYELNAAGGIMKLQSFCKIALAAGNHWAWIDTCCIDQNNNVELQKSIHSMFIWYHHSSLTIVYLSDVPSSSRSGALAKSIWNTRGWTLPEFLASKVILFYQNDWTLYLNDSSPNHKESVTIMQELEGATGIDPRALVVFYPGMKGTREILQWASTRVTTLPEDVAYSLFGIFSVLLPVIYGEKKQNSLGRLLQEIVAQSGDISALDWVGQSSEFNSCLPDDITSYEAPPCRLPPLPEDEMRTTVSSLQNTGAVELALRLHQKLYNLSAPRFAHRRLHLPCITFPVTEVRRRRSQDQEMYFTYEVKADGLLDLLIGTEAKLIQFSHIRPTQRQTLLLVRPWDRSLLELSDFANDAESEEGYWSAPGSPLQDSPCGSPVQNSPVNSEYYHSQALRLIVRLGQPFGAFLLAQQQSGEYKRIASDRDITAQVKDMASVHNMMDVRTLEIL